MTAVRFACLHNGGRSQMGAALLERAAAVRHRALSAGSEAGPHGHLHLHPVPVMAELWLDPPSIGRSASPRSAPGPPTSS